MSETQRIRKSNRYWTSEEDDRLKLAISIFGPNNWNKIAFFVGNDRLTNQCSQRWYRDLDPSINRDKWNEEEEKLLLKLVSKYGTKSWRLISKQIKNRNDVQCRYHYKKILKNEYKNKNKILENILNNISIEIDKLSSFLIFWD